MNTSLRTTSANLLVRVRDLTDDVAWRTFFDLYAPLLYRHARTLGLPAADAAEVRDLCLAELTRTLPRWHYDRSRGRFKGYLHTLVRAKVADAHRRRARAGPQGIATADTVAAAAADDPAAHWEQQWRQEHLRFCCERARALVSARTYRAFELLAHGATVAQVCAELGLTENQVYKAKGRVLAEVRRVLREHDGA